MGWTAVESIIGNHIDKERQFDTGFYQLRTFLMG